MSNSFPSSSKRPLSPNAPSRIDKRSCTEQGQSSKSYLHWPVEQSPEEGSLDVFKEEYRRSHAEEIKLPVVLEGLWCLSFIHTV
jgi:hypothetical protein